MAAHLGADRDAWGAGSQVGTQHADTMSMTAGNVGNPRVPFPSVTPP